MLDYVNPNRKAPKRIATYFGTEDNADQPTMRPFDIEAGLFTSLAEWDPAKHPRDPKGTSTGGRFAFGPDRTPAESPRELARQGSQKLWDDYHHHQTFDKDDNARVVSERMAFLLGGLRPDPLRIATLEVARLFGKDPKAMDEASNSFLADGIWREVDTARAWNKEGGDQGFREQMSIIAKSAAEQAATLRSTADGRASFEEMAKEKDKVAEIARRWAEIGQEPYGRLLAAREVVHTQEMDDPYEMGVMDDLAHHEEIDSFVNTMRLRAEHLGWTNQQILDAWDDRYHSKDPRLLEDEAYGIASCLTHAWAISAVSPESVLVQESVARLFDTPADSMDAYLNNSRSTTVTEQFKHFHKGIGSSAYFMLDETKVDTYVKATYELTQEFLAENNIEWVHALRGSNGDYDLESLEDGYVTLMANPLTSWTTSGGTAADGWSSGSKDVELVVGQNLHASRVFSVSKFGPGCPNEYEVVVIGAGRKPSRVMRAKITPQSLSFGASGEPHRWWMDFSPETSPDAPTFYDIDQVVGASYYDMSLNPFQGNAQNLPGWQKGKVTFKQMTNKIDKLRNPDPPKPEAVSDAIAKVAGKGYETSPHEVNIITNTLMKHPEALEWSDVEWLWKLSKSYTNAGMPPPKSLLEAMKIKVPEKAAGPIITHAPKMPVTVLKPGKTQTELEHEADQWLVDVANKKVIVNWGKLYKVVDNMSKDLDQLPWSHSGMSTLQMKTIADTLTDHPASIGWKPVTWAKLLKKVK